MTAIPEHEVQDYALDVLGEWIKGYETPEEGPQRRYRLLSFSDDGRSVDVRVETCDPLPSEPQDFRIWLEVEAL
ncbi:hypothetical protein ACIQMR_35315 [Streptomyces sp. NPDC091376]|uniref:hypothetical protein n=1 Tax=Streptomyces sp. NPDC091376 TaxID=3365994 RepID=UPI0038162D35